MRGQGNINDKKIDWCKRAWTPPSHYLNQCWFIVNWTHRNELQWNFNRNTNIFIDKDTCEYVCEILSISSQPQYVNGEGLWLFNVQLITVLPFCFVSWLPGNVTSHYFSGSAVITWFSPIKFSDSKKNSLLYDNQQWGWYSYHNFTRNLIWILKTKNTVMPKATR